MARMGPPISASQVRDVSPIERPATLCPRAASRPTQTSLSRLSSPRQAVIRWHAFKQTLLNAKSIIVASTTGVYLTTTLFPRFGVDSKAVKVSNRFGESLSMVNAGDVKLALQMISEILHASGVELVGAIPS